MYETHTMHRMVEQAAALHGVSAIPVGEFCFHIPDRGFVEHHPERPHKRWDAERPDDHGDTVIKSYDHALEAVRSVAS